VERGQRGVSGRLCWERVEQRRELGGCEGGRRVFKLCVYVGEEGVVFGGGEEVGAVVLELALLSEAGGEAG